MKNVTESLLLAKRPQFFPGPLLQLSGGGPGQAHQLAYLPGGVAQLVLQPEEFPVPPRQAEDALGQGEASSWGPGSMPEISSTRGPLPALLLPVEVDGLVFNYSNE